MGKMYPKQAVEIVRKLLKDCTEDSASTLFGVLSPRQVHAITFLANFVDEVRQAKDLVRVIERLCDEGIIYPADEKRSKEWKGGNQ